MTPRVVAFLGAVVLAASGVWAFLSSRSGSAPEGTLASDTIEITVGGSGGWLPVSGPSAGMLIGGAIILVSLIWQLVERNRASRQLVTTR